jgi:cell division septum initiation protein DivIVA
MFSVVGISVEPFRPRRAIYRNGGYRSGPRLVKSAPIPSPAMDVTAKELRGSDIREALRGYERDEVHALLERAAATIEHLEEQLRALQERRPTARPPHAGAGAHRLPVIEDADIGGTLIRAQKAADEAIAEAQARARQLMSDSESKAETLVSEAQSTARRVGESERVRVATEIADLAVKRDALTADADALERFGADYHARVRHAIEDDLALLG